MTTPKNPGPLNRAAVDRMITEAVAKATLRQRKAIAALSREVDQARAATGPTPTLWTKPWTPRKPTPPSEADRLRAEVERLRQLAASVTDPQLRAGYAQRLRDAQADLAQLNNPRH